MPAAIDTGMSNVSFPCRRLQSCTDKHTSNAAHCLKDINTFFKITQKDIQINLKKQKARGLKLSRFKVNNKGDRIRRCSIFKMIARLMTKNKR